MLLEADAPFLFTIAFLCVTVCFVVLIAVLYRKGRLRKKARLSQQDVSIKLDLLGLSTSREIVSRMERGQYSIRISVLRALKDIYKVDSYDEFFRDI